jgi:hypothetical protein
VNVSERRLCVFFEAGATRYAIEATSVVEVARATQDEETLRGHLAIRDLSVLLGGDPEERPGTIVLLDTSPSVAARARRVEGVFHGRTLLIGAWKKARALVIPSPTVHPPSKPDFPTCLNPPQPINPYAIAIFWPACGILIKL